MIQQIRIALIFLFGFLPLVLNAQIYPVQTVITTQAPFYNYLSYYADQNNHLQLIVTLTDFNSAPISAHLRVRIEGPGYEAYTNPNQLVGTPFILEPGVPVFLNNIDLQPYFLSSNLVKSPANLNTQNLPGGDFTICVDVVRDGPSQEVLSTNNCAFIPLTNLGIPETFTPDCESEIDSSQMFQLFTWGPPLGYQPQPGFDLNYTFYLYEWIDGNNYSTWQNVTGSIYQYQTNSISELIPLYEVPMQLGKKYIWRVQAEITDNGVPINILPNGGFSEPCSFIFGQAPTLESALSEGLFIDLDAEALTQLKGRAFWSVGDNTPNQGLSTFDRYLIEYRKKPDSQNSNPLWHYDTLMESNKFIYQLSPETTYEVRVSGINGSFVSAPSDIAEFTTPATVDYACGDQQLPYRPPLFDPNDHVTAGNQVQIGQFLMTITEAIPLGSAGHYSGQGTIPIDFLAGAKAKVRFDDILIDEEYVVRYGRVDVKTEGVDSWLNEQYQQFIDPIYVDGTIDSAWVDTTTGTAWAIVDGVAQEFVFDPPDYPIIINDASGYQWTIWPNGTITVSSFLDLSNDHLDVSAADAGNFQQNDNENFGFDGKEHMEWHENYEVILLSDSTHYFVPNKSIGKSLGDVVDILVPTGVTPTFKLDDLTTLSASPFGGGQGGGNTFTVTIPAISQTGEHAIYAYDGTDRIAKLNVHVYKEKEREVVIVPLTNAPIDQAQVTAAIQGTLGEANLKINVTIAPQWNNAEFPASMALDLPDDPGLLTKYSDQMKELRENYFFENPNAETKAYYIFVVGNFDDPNENGYMPRGKSIGFVKNTSQMYNVIAHELGHGIGALEHSWKNSGPSRGSTNNLMDYSSSSSENLTLSQWDKIRSVDYLPNIWDDTQDGSNANVLYAEYNISNSFNSTEFDWADNTDIPPGTYFKIGEFTYVTFSNSSSIDKYGFSNGILTKLLIEGHETVLSDAAYGLTDETQGGYTVADSKVNNLYNFLCTGSTCSTQRELDTVNYNGALVPTIKAYAEHDFRYGVEIEKVNCEEIPGQVIVGFDHTNNSVIYDYPQCPPSNNEQFHIPLSWRGADHTVCFMTPDGKTFKIKALGIRGLDFSLGLNEAETPMMPAGCLTSFSVKEDISTDEISHYSAEYVNGEFTGYKKEDGSKYFNKTQPAAPEDFGILMLPSTGGLVAYKYEASNANYVYHDSIFNPQVSYAVLSLENDPQEIFGTAIQALEGYAYPDDHMTAGTINNEFTSELFNNTMTSFNQQRRLVTKILELRTQYPELYDRMSTCDFSSWGCISWTSVAAMSLGLQSETAMNAALGNSYGWGYFDYCYDNFSYQNLSKTEQFQKFLFHFNELIAFNRQIQQNTIDEFLDGTLCFEELDGGPISGAHPNWESEVIIEALDAMSIDEIKEICLQTRVNLIACLSFKTYVTNDYEKCIYRLIDNTPASDRYNLVDKLCTQEYNNTVLIKKLPETLDDQVFFFGTDDYFTLVMNKLITYYAEHPNIVNTMNIENLTNAQVLDLRSRMITYHYSGFVKRLANGCTGTLNSSSLSNISNVDIVESGGEWKVTFEDNLQMCFINLAQSSNRSFTLTDPLIVSDEANLIEIYDANTDAMALPAFVLYFIEEKAIANTAVEAIETAIDVATLFIPGGQGKLFFRVLNYADKMSSVTNMAANYTELDNPMLSKYLSLTSGILGFTDLTATGLTKFRNLRSVDNAEDAVSLITRNSNELGQSQASKVRELLDKIDAETDPNLIAVLNNPTAKQALIETLEQEQLYLQKLGKTNLAQDVGERILKLENAGNVIVRGVSKTDFLNSVTDFANNPQLGDQAWTLFVNEDWNGLENLITSNNINGGWPPNFGFINISSVQNGSEVNGRIFDRFQKQFGLGGGYASPIEENQAPFTLASRALGVNYDDLEDLGQNFYYFKFRIIQAPTDLKIENGNAIPWFGDPGGAMQMKSSKGFHEYLSGIEILEKWEYNNGTWTQISL